MSVRTSVHQDQLAPTRVQAAHWADLFIRLCAGDRRASVALRRVTR